MSDRMPTNPFPRALNAAHAKAILAAEDALNSEKPFRVGDGGAERPEKSGSYHAAKLAVDASWEILARPWSERVRVSDRYRSLAGDFWNLLHSARSHVTGDDVLLAQIDLAIAEYDRLDGERKAQPTTGGETDGGNGPSG